MLSTVGHWSSKNVILWGFFFGGGAGKMLAMVTMIWVNSQGPVEVPKQAPAPSASQLVSPC